MARRRNPAELLLLNPEGTAPVDPQTQTPAFRRWFGDSKVVDENGEPLVVYHGTISGGFSAFTVPENDRSKPPGIFFTDYLPMAKAYTYSDFYGTIKFDDDGRPVITKRVVIDEDREKDPTPDFPLADRAEVEGVVPVGIYAVFLRIENPLVVDAEGNHWQEIPVYDEHGNRTDTEDTNYLVRRALRTGLYDGVIVKNVVDYNLKRFGEPATVYVVFDPKQIKSARKNIGAFDPNDPDIRRNPGTPDDFFVWVPSVHHTQHFDMPVQPQEVWLALDVTPTRPPTSKVFDPSTGEVVGERPFRPAHGVNALVQEVGSDWRWHNGVLTLNTHSTAPHMKKGAWLFVRVARRNPSDDARVARAMAILEDTSLDSDVATDLANRILAGEDVAAPRAPVPAKRPARTIGPAISRAIRDKIGRDVTTTPEIILYDYTPKKGASPGSHGPETSMYFEDYGHDAYRDSSGYYLDFREVDDAALLGKTVTFVVGVAELRDAYDPSVWESEEEWESFVSGNLDDMEYGEVCIKPSGKFEITWT